MTTQTEALKIALEALKQYSTYEGATAMADKAISAIYQALAQQSNEQVEPAFWYRNEDIFGNQEMEPIFYATKAWVNCLPLYTHPPVPTAQPKEPEQKPKCIGKAWAMWGGPVVFDPPLTQTEQRSVSEHLEPVAWMHWLRGPVRLFLNKDEAMLELERLNRDYASDKDARMMRPLVFGDLPTTPPQHSAIARKPLTDEQIQECWYRTQGEAENFARAIEAAHGIKE